MPFHLLGCPSKAQAHVINNSGHYRPPPSNFRSFVHMLKASGADMSHVSISKSYAVLVGLEAYVHTQRKIKSALHSAHERKDRLLHSKTAAGGREQEKNRSQSPKKERRFSGNQKEIEKGEKAGQQDKVMRDGNTSILKVMQKLHISPQTPQHGTHPKELPEEGKAPAGDEGWSATPPSSSPKPS
ncbi:MAG: hypothetical protein M1813_001191 [Trichoglossum hirsutum]|nr:MAG: hypothetical protein M1813_001191 [Trichoglossum hirsutum]